MSSKENQNDASSTSDVSELSGSECLDLEEGNDIAQLINHFFTNEEGKNIADILTELKSSLDTHNKLIYKLLALNSQKKS